MQNSNINGVNGTSDDDQDVNTNAQGENTNSDANDTTKAAASSGSDSGNDATGDDGGSNSGEGDDNSEGGRTFTQDEVSKMMAREKKQGRNAVYNELGINPNDRRMVKMIKSLVATQKQEDEDGDGETVDVKLQEAERRATMAELKANILAQNVSSQFVDDAVTLVSTRLETEDGLDANSAISDLKKKYPNWFTDTGSEEDQKAKRGTGSSIGAMANQAGKSGSDEQASFGKRLAASRKASSKSGFSYFGNSK